MRLAASRSARRRAPPSWSDSLSKYTTTSARKLGILGTVMVDRETVPPTDRTRERTLTRLREGYACGALATGTFDRRLDVALRARTRGELSGLTVDLPDVSSWWRRAGSALRERLRPEPPPVTGGVLAAADLSADELSLGRSSRCAITLADDTVSRHHATLRRREGRWYLVDLGSSNGTWVNDRRVFDAEVRAGDEVRLGQVRFRL